MSWNYRVTRQTKSHPTQGEWVEYAIREVYYLHIEGEDKVGWTDPVALTGETPDDVRADLELILEDGFKKPVLDITDEGNPFEVSS